MILNINNERRINYDNVIDEQIVEKRQNVLKIKFTFVNNQFIVLLMTEDEYTNFKNATGTGSQIVNLNCSIVELLKG